MKIPFGIAQIGKAFRNEIVARQFIFRMREFEQMEMQFFVRPGTEMRWWNEWKNTRMAEQRAAFSVSQYMSDEQCASLLDKVDSLEGARLKGGI